MLDQRFTLTLWWLLRVSLLLSVVLVGPATVLADAPDTQGDSPTAQGGPTGSTAAPGRAVETLTDLPAQQWRDVQPLPLTAAPGAAALPDPQQITPAALPAQQGDASGLSWLTRQVNVGNWVVDAVLGGTTAQIHTINEAVLVGVEGLEARLADQTGCQSLIFCISPALFFQGVLGAQILRLWGPFQVLAIGLITVFVTVQLNQLQLEGGQNRIAGLKEIGTLVLFALVVSLAGQWPVTLLLLLFQGITEILLGVSGALNISDLLAFNLHTAGLFQLGASLIAFLLSLGWVALVVLVVVRWFRIALLLLLLPLVGPCLLLRSTRRYASFWLDSLIGILLQHCATVAAFTLGAVLLNTGVRPPTDGNAATALVWGMSSLVGLGFAFCGTSLFNGLLGNAGASTSSRSPGAWVRATAGQALSVAAGQRAGMTTGSMRGSLASGALLGGLSGGLRGALLGSAASGLTYRRRALTAAEGTLGQAFTGHAQQLRASDSTSAERQRRLTPEAQEQLAVGDLQREQQRRTQLGQLGRAVVRGTLTEAGAQQQAIQLATAEHAARAVQIRTLAAADGTLGQRSPAEQVAHNRQVQAVADRLRERQRTVQRQYPPAASAPLDAQRAHRRAAMLARWEQHDRAAATADAAEVVAQGNDPAVLSQMEQRADVRATRRAARIARLDAALHMTGPATDLQRLQQVVTVTHRQQAVAQRQAVRAQRETLLQRQRSAEGALVDRRPPAGLSPAQQHVVVRYEGRWAREDRAAAQRAAEVVVTGGSTPEARDGARAAADARGTARAARRAQLHRALGQPGPGAGWARLQAVEQAIRTSEEGR